MPKPKAYSYLRFSTSEQQKGDSHRRQVELSQQYANKHDLDLDENLTFKDLGVSAYRGKNILEGALGSFIEAVDSGRVKRGSYLLVESLDRLSRDKVPIAFNRFTSLLEKEINIVTLQDSRVYTKQSISESFSDLMISLATMFRAHEESLTKSKRIKAGWSNKKKKAQEKGLKLTSNCPAWLKLNKESNSFEIVRDREKIIKRMFQMALDGYGNSIIARRLNQEAIKPFGRSNGWQPSYIHRVLEGPAVIGEFQPMKVKIVKGRKTLIPDGSFIDDYFPPIIPKETFLKIQEMRKSRRWERGRKGIKFSNLFTGLAKCGVCSGSMHYINKSRGGMYLVCANSRNGLRECKSYSWRYKHAEVFILLTLKEVDYRDLFPLIYTSSKEKLNDLEDTLLIRKEDLTRIKKQAENLVSVLADMPDNPSIKDKLAEFTLIQETITQEVNTLETQIETERNLLNNLDQDHKDAKDAFKEWVNKQRSGNEKDAYDARCKLHQHLKKIVEKIMLHPSKKKDLHGEIEILFNNTSDYKRIIKVERLQKSAESIKIYKNKAEKDHFLMEIRKEPMTYNPRLSR